MRGVRAASLKKSACRLREEPGVAEWELEFDVAQAGAGVGGVGGVKRQVYRVRGEEEADWVSFRARGNQERAVAKGHNGKELLGGRVGVDGAVDAPE